MPAREGHRREHHVLRCRGRGNRGNIGHEDETCGYINGQATPPTPPTPPGGRTGACAPNHAWHAEDRALTQLRARTQSWSRAKERAHEGGQDAAQHRAQSITTSPSRTGSDGDGGTRGLRVPLTGEPDEHGQSYLLQEWPTHPRGPLCHFVLITHTGQSLKLGSSE